MRGASVFGAGMAHTAVNNGHCGELVPNILAGERNLSRVARVGSERECIVESYPSPVCGPIVNLFVSEGRNGQVIRIDVRTRTGAQPSLAQAIRDSLRPIADSHGHIGMGGFFKVLGGRVRSHVMPDYGCIGFDYYDTERERVVRDFLQFYEHMGPDLLCFSTLWTGDPTAATCISGRPANTRTSTMLMTRRSRPGITMAISRPGKCTTSAFSTLRNGFSGLAMFMRTSGQVPERHPLDCGQACLFYGRRFRLRPGITR